MQHSKKSLQLWLKVKIFARFNSSYKLNSKLKWLTKELVHFNLLFHLKFKLKNLTASILMKSLIMFSRIDYFQILIDFDIEIIIR